ncbi:MAG: L,D-transpeptidase family protein [Pseudomonadota bacterium]
MMRCKALVAVLALVTGVGSVMADEPGVRAIMQEVLAGRMSVAQQQLESLAATADSHLVAQLTVELGDMASGNYATRDNRAFKDLAPLWADARAQWVATHTPTQPATLPASVLSLDRAIKEIFVVDGKRSVAWLLTRGDGGWQIGDGFYVSIGTEGLDKRRRGDAKTPLGIYWIVEELDSTRLPPRYGVRVFPLDYPNVLDRLQRRTGDGIWIHGIDPDNNIRPPLDTDGCVALVNERILALGSRLSPQQTPVIIVDGVDWQRPRTSRLNALRETLYAWRDALASGDESAYFDAFVDDYARFGMSHSLWRAGRQAALANAASLSIEIDSLSVFLADKDTDVFLTRFRQQTKRGDAEPITIWRRLYWQRGRDGRFRIIAEQNG